MELAFDTLGEARADGADVVLLHGTPSSPSHFGPLMEALSATHRVHVPHLPGYGRTPPAPPGFSLAERVAGLGRALRGRGLERAHLVGFSGGVPVGLMLALEGGIEPLSVFALAGACALPEPVREAYRQTAAALRSGADLGALQDGAAPRFLSPAYAARPDAVAEVRAWIADVDRETLAAELVALADELPDLTPRLSSLRCRVTARTGALDQSTPPELARALADAAPDGELQIVDGAGHALLIEDFDATVAAIRATLT
jgi:pimeloyl-ACP methyl ester carboxylesterase